MNTTVILTDRELSLLDGQCSDKVQREVDQAKTRLDALAELPEMPAKHAAFIARVVTVAREKRKLTFVRVDMRSCPVCGEVAGYATYARTSRYHKKGDPNYKRPKSLYGVDLDRGFVVMKGYPSLGVCNQCLTEIKSLLVDALAGIKAELPTELQGDGPRYKRYDNRHCTECDWRGHEGQMGKLLTLFGNGYYQGQCPKCKAENKPLGPTLIKSVKGYTVVEINN